MKKLTVHCEMYELKELYAAIDNFRYATGDCPNYLIMSRATFYELERNHNYFPFGYLYENPGKYTFQGIDVAFNNGLGFGDIDVV